MYYSDRLDKQSQAFIAIFHYDITACNVIGDIIAGNNENLE